MDWFLKVTQNYAGFSGRAQRKEFWMFGLFYAIFFVVLTFIDRTMQIYSQTLGVGLSSGLFSLAMATPSLAVSARRLHDIGKSGIYNFILLIPIIGLIALIVLWSQDGKPGENKYGPNPKTSPEPSFVL